MPQFTRYDINKEQNAVISSWDFAVPKENYFGEVKYDDSSTIYSRFWERYFHDRYDVNTKKVECNVNLIGIDVTKENLRNIYYFSNCYWVLNKITNYDPCSTETTKCEFIKVNNVSNYTIGQNLWFLSAQAEAEQAAQKAEADRAAAEAASRTTSAQGQGFSDCSCSPQSADKPPCRPQSGRCGQWCPAGPPAARRGG